MEEKKEKTSFDWNKEDNIIIINPDGWDRNNYEYSFSQELITKDEYDSRVLDSTIQISVVICDVCNPRPKSKGNVICNECYGRS